MPKPRTAPPVAVLAAVLTAEVAHESPLPGDAMRTAADATELVRIAAAARRRSERACNGEGHYSERGWAWDENDDARRERADARATDRANKILEPYGAKVQELGGDPRGPGMRIALASGARNGWGDGWAI